MEGLAPCLEFNARTDRWERVVLSAGTLAGEACLPEDKPLQVSSFNILICSPFPGTPVEGLSTDAARFAYIAEELIPRLGADILALQEAAPPFTEQFLCRSQYVRTHYYVSCTADDRNTHACVLLSKFPFWYDPRHSAFKLKCFFVPTHSGKILNLGVAHLVAQEARKYQTYRAQQLQKLLQVCVGNSAQRVLAEVKEESGVKVADPKSRSQQCSQDFNTVTPQPPIPLHSHSYSHPAASQSMNFNLMSVYE